MKLYWRMGWRNIWRNKGRSTITVGAMAFSVTLLIFFSAFMESWGDQMQRNVTDMTVGQLQVHHPLYLSDQNLYQLVEDSEKLIAELANAGYRGAPRNFGYGLLASDRSGKSAGVQLRSVDLELEAKVTSLHDPKNLFQGEYLSGATRIESPPQMQESAAVLFEDPLGEEDDFGWQPLDLTVGEVVLGKKLATSLGVHPGDTVNVVIMAADGTLGNELFDVVGIFKNFSEIEDRVLTLMTSEDYRRLFRLPEGKVHEIAIGIPASEDLLEAKARMQTLAGEGVEVKSWREILPAIAEMVDLQSSVLIVFSLMMFIGAGLLIMNSMLMMVFERIREFGVMKALGLKGKQLVVLVFFETFWMSVLAGVLGSAVGIPLTIWVGHVGIDLSAFAPDGFAISGTVIDPVMTTTLTPTALEIPLVTLFAVSFLSVIYPAVKAAVIEPIEALHHI